MGMNKLQLECESDRDSFVEIPKAEFDSFARSGDFQQGPIIEDHSRFMREFGPYSPERWAFGVLNDDRRVKTKVQPQ